MHNYQDIKDALYYRESFVGNSMRGQRTNARYYVYSYDTLILKYSLDESRTLMFNNTYYSNTTSRHQSLIRAAFPDATGGHADRVVYDY